MPPSLPSHLMPGLCPELLPSDLATCCQATLSTPEDAQAMIRVDSKGECGDSQRVVRGITVRERVEARSHAAEPPSRAQAALMSSQGAGAAAVPGRGVLASARRAHLKTQKSNRADGAGRCVDLSSWRRWLQAQNEKADAGPFHLLGEEVSADCPGVVAFSCPAFKDTLRRIAQDKADDGELRLIEKRAPTCGCFLAFVGPLAHQIVASAIAHLTHLHEV